MGYSAWASQRLVHAASELSEAELLRNFQTADRSVLGTLVHTFAADRLWLTRLQRSPRPQYSSEADYHLTVLQSEWPEVYRQWDQLLNDLSDDEARADLTYQDMRGNTWTQPIWQLVLHVVNHATHHRGQVAGFLRTMGRVPPVLDLVAYYRSR
ncbi:MAG TPA: DinB family protein [Candidatus Solibacter sp.]